MTNIDTDTITDHLQRLLTIDAHNRGRFHLRFPGTGTIQRVDGSHTIATVSVRDTRHIVDEWQLTITPTMYDQFVKLGAVDSEPFPLTGPFDALINPPAEPTHTIPLSAITHDTGANLDDIIAKAEATLRGGTNIEPVDDIVARPWTTASTLEAPPRDGIAHTATPAEGDTMNTTSTRQTGIGVTTLLEDGVVDALEAATGDQPVAIDDFARDQTAAQNAGNTDPDTYSRWIQSMPIGTAAATIGRLQSIADEHRRRAVTAESLAEAMRSSLHDVANAGQRFDDGIAASSGGR